MARHPRTFGDAARRAVRRLAWAHMLTMLGRTGPWVWGLVLAAMVAARVLGSYREQTPWVAAAVALWLAAAGAWAWLRRHSPVAALAIWDERAQRGEAFVSAYCFEMQDHADAAQQVHLIRARAMLGDAWPAMRRQLPSPLPWQAVLPMALVLAIASMGGLVAPVPRDLMPLDPDAIARAKLVGQDIVRRQKDVERLQAMTPQEKEKARQLQQAMSDTGERMAGRDTQTPQDVLSQLEGLARQAEALARAMAGEAQQLSSAMIEELERHADTADLGAALRASRTDQIASEARQIGEHLQSDKLTLDERQRFEDALDRAMKAADEQDRQSPVGRKIDQADRHLKDQQPREAGRRFDELAREFDRFHERRLAADRLQQLAEELRGGGQRIMQLPGEGIQQLAQAQHREMRGARQLPGGIEAQLMPHARMPRPDAMPMPGDGDLDHRMVQFMPGHGEAPVPGQEGMPPMGGGLPGDMPPVPGLGGNMPSGGGGNIPIPGSAMAGGALASNSAQPGGLHAGVGTAPLGNSSTTPHDATGTATVAASPVNAGPSTLQVIEGQHRREETAIAARLMAVNFIAAEEEALLAEPLPVARREQVLRYFTMLRQQLERTDHP